MAFHVIHYRKKDDQEVEKYYMPFEALDVPPDKKAENEIEKTFENVAELRAHFLKEYEQSTNFNYVDFKYVLSSDIFDGNEIQTKRRSVRIAAQKETPIIFYLQKPREISREANAKMFKLDKELRKSSGLKHYIIVQGNMSYNDFKAEWDDLKSEHLELPDLSPLPDSDSPPLFRWKRFWSSLLTLESPFSLVRLTAGIEILLIVSLIISAAIAPGAEFLSKLLVPSIIGAALIIVGVVLPLLFYFPKLLLTKEWDWARAWTWASEHKGELITLGIGCLLAIGVAIFCGGFAAGNPAFDFRFMHTIFDFLSTVFAIAPEETPTIFAVIFSAIPLAVTLAASGISKLREAINEAINAGYGIKSPEAAKENTDQEDKPTGNLRKQAQQPAKKPTPPLKLQNLHAASTTQPTPRTPTTLYDQVFSDQNEKDEEKRPYVRATSDCHETEQDLLTFKQGDLIVIKKGELGNDFWVGLLDGKEGKVPVQYIQPVPISTSSLTASLTAQHG